jgi:tRNA-splicing ligase RtcB
LVLEDVKDRLERIVDRLFSLIPAGVGSEGAIPKLPGKMKNSCWIMAPWAVAQGYGRQEDVSVMEEGGRLASADADLLSDRALERGLKQVGTLVRETISSK